MISVNNALATTLTLAGPDLTNHNLGWPSTGIQITALQNVTLQSFNFANYGASDTIELTDTNGLVLYSTSYAGGGDTNQLITTDWAMTAGTTYNLLSLERSNSMWQDYSNFPQANAQIQVNGGFSYNP